MIIKKIDNFAYIFIVILIALMLIQNKIWFIPFLLLPINIHILYVSLKKIKKETYIKVYILFLLQYIIIFKSNAMDTNIVKSKITIELFISLVSGIIILFNKVGYRKMIKGSGFFVTLFLLYNIFSLVTIGNINGINVYYLLKLILTVILSFHFVYYNFKKFKSINKVVEKIYYLLSIIQSFIWVYGCIDLKSSLSLTLTGFYRFGGIIIHPTTMSTLSVLILFYSLVSYNSKNKIKKKNIFISVISILMTNSRLAMLTMLLVIFVYNKFFIKKSKQNWLRALLFTVFLNLIFIFILLKNSLREMVYFRALSIVTRGAGIENITNLSGRKELWNLGKDLISKKLFLGYGFNSSESLVKLHNTGPNLLAGSFENAYFNLFIELGLVGILIFLIMLVVTFKKPLMYYKYRKKTAIYMSLPLFLILFEGFSQPSFSKGNVGIQNLLFYTFIWIIIIWREYENKKNSRTELF